MRLPTGPKYGVKSSKAKTTPSGMAPKIIHGRYVPQRDCVRSASEPISGSVTTSKRRATSIRVAVSATVRPKMLVKNSGNAIDITFQVIPPAAASPRA